MSEIQAILQAGRRRVSELERLRHQIAQLETDRDLTRGVCDQADRHRHEANRHYAENGKLRKSLTQIAGLASTDGPAAPLLVRAGEVATAALTLPRQEDAKEASNG